MFLSHFSKKLKIASSIIVIIWLAFVPATSWGMPGLPLEEDEAIPASCVDVDEDGRINEINCGAPGNERCVTCGFEGEIELVLELAEEPGGDIDPAGGTDWMGIDLTIQDVFSIITGIACWLTRISTAVMVIFIILAGLRFMAARGDPTRWTAAKKNFNHVLIGALIILGVYVIIATIANVVGVNSFSLIPLVC